MIEGRPDRHRGQRQGEGALQALVGERKVDDECKRECERPATREGEEQGEQKQTKRAAQNPSCRNRQAVPRRALQGRDSGHDEHDGEHVPVADRGAQASIEVGVCHHLGQHLAKEGVRSEGHHDADVTIARHTQLDGACRCRRDNDSDHHIQQCDIESQPRQVWAKRPGDRQSLPHRKQRERRKADDGGPAKPLAARRCPYPGDGERHQHEHDGCRAVEDVAPRQK